FAPHYNTVEAEHDKCVKFESGLRPEIKHLIGFSEIRDFPTLVNKSRICDEDGRARANHYKMANEKKGKDGNRWKPYDNKGKKCGGFGHKSFECKKNVVCFNCNEEGHKSPECKKPKKNGGK
ncbi:cellular nucleic acid-binding protein, partial [Trifolium medium]|nr:cellular nucleic acid-binding protein [Trifolium medium]